MPDPFGGVGGGIISPTGAAFAFSVPGPLGVGGGTISPTGATPNSFRTPGQNGIEANGGPFNEPSASVLPPSLPFTTQLYADIMEGIRGLAETRAHASFEYSSDIATAWSLSSLSGYDDALRNMSTRLRRLLGLTASCFYMFSELPRLKTSSFYKFSGSWGSRHRVSGLPWLKASSFYVIS